ncbi:hypothetical protein ACTRXD_00445 [Nitrospira sp. T9]|uniref:hypothetical protein n=1 Tax=unclassified Nitrospira TaxID=2652172 RepID=UPI003F9A6351
MDKELEDEHAKVSGGLGTVLTTIDSDTEAILEKVSEPPKAQRGGKTLSKDPDRLAIYHRWRAKIKLLEKDENDQPAYNEALYHITQAIENDEQDPESYKIKCRIHRLQKDDAEVIKALKDAIVVAPHESWFWVSWIEVLAKQGKFQDIPKVIAQAKKVSGSKSLPWVLRGHAFQLKGKNLAAFRAFNRALREEKLNERARVGKNEALKRLQELESYAIKKELYENQQTTEAMSEEKGTTVLEPSLSVGEIIRKDLIDGLEITVEEAANKTGIDRKYLYQIIGGERAVSKNVAVKLSKLFDECRRKTGKIYTVKKLLKLQFDLELENQTKDLDIEPHLI